MNERIDDLLNQPLASVADAGFSARVMGRVKAQRRRQLALTYAGFAVCFLLAILLLPLPSIGAEFGTLVPKIAGSWAVNIAAALLVLTYFLDRQFSRL